MAKSRIGDVVFLRLGAKSGKVRDQDGVYREFVADDPVSYGEQVRFIEDVEQGRAVTKKR